MPKTEFLVEAPKKSNLFWLSASKIKNFQTCKAQYYFRYVERLPKKEWPHLYFGKFLHEVLEFFQKEIKAGNTAPDNVILKECFKRSYDNYSKKIDAAQKMEAFNILCQFLVKRAEKKKENKISIPLYIEKPFNLVLNDDILVNGFIDFVHEDYDKLIHVTDYKTNKEKKYLLKDLFQLELYSYILSLEDESLERIRASYSLLKLGFDEIETEFSRDKIMKTGDYIVKCAEEIRSEKLFRAKPSGLCNYCDYLDHCKEGEDFVKMLDAKKAKKDGKIHLATYGETSW